MRIAGIAKGSGMIAPDMATMLAFVATDAAIARPALQTLVGLYTRDDLQRGDGRRRPLDQRHLPAVRHRRARARRGSRRAGDRRLADFREKLDQVMLDLAQQLVRDGEGATKFVKVKVDRRREPASARKIARTIAESPLVKTAFAGEDANWGRVVMAVGDAPSRSPRPADRPLRRPGRGATAWCRRATTRRR